MAVANQREAEQEARKNTPLMPFRFFTPVGDTKEIVIVDDAPSFVRHEHCMQDKRTKRWDVFLPCIDENCNCPACSVSSRPSYFAMYFTVIDLTPYVNGDGDEVPFSKKLLVVKTAQQKKLIRLYERHGTLRGMVLAMTRDGEKTASIGDPEFVEFMEEADLQSYVYDYTDKEGVVHEVLCDEPYDYEALFPEVDEETLAALVGGGGDSTGSRRDDDRSLGRGRGRAQQDDDYGRDAGGWDGGGGRRVASRRAPAAPAADEQDDVQDDQQEQAPARSTRPVPRRAAPAAAPAAPARSARPAPRRPAPAAETLHPDDDPSVGADDDTPPFDTEDDAPAAPAPRSARPAPRRAAPAPAPEPAAARPNVAARRANLRR